MGSFISRTAPASTAGYVRLSLGLEGALIVAIVAVAIFTAIVVLLLGARRMRRLADQKMRFVAGVSHELRTPVAAISILSRNQADGLVTDIDNVKRYGELIHQQSRRLSEMTEQALEYAGIQSGLRQPARAAVDLHGLIQAAVALRREDLAREGIEVELDLGSAVPPISGDAHLLRVALDNLLTNAHKYARAEGWIRVSCRYSRAAREVQISVEDRGGGIDPVDQEEIFEPFYRGRAAVEAQIPGAGLGLSLVRSAAEVHHGSVTLASTSGVGSTFTLHLPA